MLSALFCGAMSTEVFAASQIVPGTTWYDTKGQKINAHGNCVVYHDGAYYWFGEDRTKSKSNGVAVYKSTNLLDWERLGLAFESKDAYDAETDNCILERPKVVYNEGTKKWVLSIHWENGDGYGRACVLMATSDKIEGPYTKTAESPYRPNLNDSRDQTLFVDTDGTAYHFGSTNMNTNMLVTKMDATYTNPIDPKEETKILNGLKYEAPAIFKMGDTYFGLFSGCTGWDPNPGHSAWTTDIMGWWNTSENFAVDDGKGTTYKSQSSYVLKLHDNPDALIYMGDRWVSSDVGGQSTYIWLPLSMRSGYPVVRWFESWDLSVLDEAGRYKRPAEIVSGNTYMILGNLSDRFVSYKNNSFSLEDDDAETNLVFAFEAVDGKKWTYRLKDEKTGKYLEALFGKSLRLADKADKTQQEWFTEQREDGTFSLKSEEYDAYLTVSGASTSAGASLYLTKKNEEYHQGFSIVFDTKQRPDEAQAATFTKEDREKCEQIIKEQEAYRADAGISSVTSGNEVAVYPSVNDGRFTVETSAVGNVQVQVVELGLGRIAYAANFVADGTPKQFDLSGCLSAGVYAVTVVAAGGKTVAKMIVR